MQYDDISQLPQRYQEQILRKMGKAFGGVGADDLKKTINSATAGAGGGIPKPTKKSKYGNEKTELGGLKFDSKKEAGRFLELREMEKRGEISDLRLQVNFTLIEGYTKPTGERVRPEVYKADFTYKKSDANGDFTVFVAEDVKSAGTRTEKYRIKKKQMWEKFHIEIQEV